MIKTLVACDGAIKKKAARSISFTFRTAASYFRVLIGIMSVAYLPARDEYLSTMVFFFFFFLVSFRLLVLDPRVNVASLFIYSNAFLLSSIVSEDDMGRAPLPS